MLKVVYVINVMSKSNLFAHNVEKFTKIEGDTTTSFPEGQDLNHYAQNACKKNCREGVNKYVLR